MYIDFVKNRSKFYAFAVFLTLVCLLSIIFLPLNLGIDVTWGTQAEFDYQGNLNLDGVKKIAENAKNWLKWSEAVNTVTVYQVTWEKKFVVETWFSKNKITEKDLEVLKVDYKTNLIKQIAADESKPVLTKYTNIWEVFWEYIRKTAYVTIFLVIISISLYIGRAFRKSEKNISWFSFAAVTMISLFHDVVAALGLYIITGHFLKEFKIDIFFITAMLTVLGYSVSDTIVIMDRIRTVLQRQKWVVVLGKVVNDAINSTLTRSIYTPLMVILMLAAMFLFWPQSIKGFTLAMIYWTIVWTYSSIALAATVLYDFNKKKFK